MSKWHPILFLTFFALGVVTYVAFTRLTSPPEPVFVAVGSAQEGWGVTPNHEPHHLRPEQSPTAETVATAVATAEPIATAEPVATAEPSVTADPVLTTIEEALPAEPQQAAPSAPAFFTVDTTLYARANARLRAAPSTTADVLTKLTADAPLHAIARATDGAWWQVSLAGGRTGYVSRAAVSKNRTVPAKPPAAAPAPVAVAAPPEPVPAGGSQGTLCYADEAMSWFTETAARGTARPANRTDR